MAGRVGLSSARRGDRRAYHHHPATVELVRRSPRHDERERRNARDTLHHETMTRAKVAAAALGGGCRGDRADEIPTRTALAVASVVPDAVAVKDGGGCPAWSVRSPGLSENEEDGGRLPLSRSEGGAFFCRGRGATSARAGGRMASQMACRAGRFPRGRGVRSTPASRICASKSNACL